MWRKGDRTITTKYIFIYEEKNSQELYHLQLRMGFFNEQWEGNATNNVNNNKSNITLKSINNKGKDEKGLYSISNIYASVFILNVHSIWTCR